MASKAGRVVFIGNIPYGVTEETIIDTLSRVGQVLNFRLVYDKETGKPKGFGFAEFIDADAAASAVRNLNDYEMMGRKLRVDYSNDGAAHESHSVPSNYTAPPPLTTHPDPSLLQQMSGVPSLPPLPPGADVPPNLLAIDVISTTLKTLPPAQLLDILSQMKGLVASDPSKATELLKAAPQLSYAVFQSLLLLGLVEQDVLASVLEHINGYPPPPQHQQQQQYQVQYPPMSNPIMGAAPTPPPQYGMQAPPPQQAPAPALGGRDDLIRQVMSLSPAQIEAMPPAEKAQLMMLRQQFAAGGR
ncbi:hypothetical protein P152DRAFT_408534 [Eremomyces bilateralis CBS 781.70]|uniref:RRM domain-containing protein n=1 Tax=Eremomyces bilateralis CBS 781.70 TaxID=1392243 RepID=A0A6G1GDA5_9PEZI|nr:uncharacterized protein P152DRAFT_408534 [Eremomyces bilateralis CBS 781.70]KAF1816013.1 hypothetical protein P152DRAFT_408534 [Eremomyces bilateralis CBS 781.70]